MRPRQRAYSWYPTMRYSHGVVGCAAACSCHHRGPAIPSTCGQRETQVVLARSALPVCGPSQDGQGCYVWSASKFNICRGARGAWIETSARERHAAWQRQGATSGYNLR